MKRNQYWRYPFSTEPCLWEEKYSFKIPFLFKTKPLIIFQSPVFFSKTVLNLDEKFQFFHLCFKASKCFKFRTCLWGGDFVTPRLLCLPQGLDHHDGFEFSQQQCWQLFERSRFGPVRSEKKNGRFPPGGSICREWRRKIFFWGGSLFSIFVCKNLGGS